MSKANRTMSTKFRAGEYVWLLPLNFGAPSARGKVKACYANGDIEVEGDDGLSYWCSESDLVHDVSKLPQGRQLEFNLSYELDSTSSDSNTYNTEDQKKRWKAEGCCTTCGAKREMSIWGLLPCPNGHEN